MKLSLLLSSLTLLPFLLTFLLLLSLLPLFHLSFTLPHPVSLPHSPYCYVSAFFLSFTLPSPDSLLTV